jgi:hypothetical protein
MGQRGTAVQTVLRQTQRIERELSPEARKIEDRSV